MSPEIIDAIAQGVADLAPGLIVIGAGIGIGLVGRGAAEATGRNPSAFGKVIATSLILAALVEGLAFIALFVKI